MNAFFLAAYRTALLSAVFGLVVGCASSRDAPKPAELGPNAALIGVRPAWNVKLDSVEFPLTVKVTGDSVLVASASGILKSLNSQTGAVLWSTKVGAPISAGIGGDGRQTAVLTVENELVVFEESNEIWRQPISAQGFTAPLVAGGRVFLLAADRSVLAFDVVTGRKLWAQQRASDSLVLRQSGVLLAVGNTLVVGLSGKLVGLNPSNGSVLWEAAISTPRGINEIERLVDLVGGASRVADVVCARSFQSSIGCVDAARGRLLWTKSASGSVGLDGDEQRIYGVEGNGELVAWARADGARVWGTDRLKFRHLTAPLVLGRSVVVGDDVGIVHWLSREDGSSLTRMPTDGSRISVAPVLASGTLVVVTRNGGVFGFQPE
jgi:outer membrane protein assembly factor BamB